MGQWGQVTDVRSVKVVFQSETAGDDLFRCASTAMQKIFHQFMAVFDMHP